MSDEGFESALSSSTQQKSGNYFVKRPYRKIQPVVERAIKILQIDLDRLDRHKKNIVKFELLQEWSSLNKEQINSSRTVQQLKSNIKQLEQIRMQVADEDVELFDDKVAEIQENAVVSVREFLQVQTAEVLIPGTDLKGMCEEYQAHSSVVEPVSLPVCDNSDWTKSRSLSESTTDVLLLQDQVVAAERDAEARQSWGELKQNLEELNGLIHDFSTLVHEQQTAVDSIEDNVEHAQMNVSEGIAHLVDANKLKAAALPVAGALIGTVMGGPFGLLVGVKAGLAAAGVGTVIGFTGGSYLKKRQADKLDIEMSNLSKERSHSLPDLSNEYGDKDTIQTTHNDET